MSVDPLRQAIGLAAIVALGCHAIWYTSRSARPQVRHLALTSFLGHAVLGVGIWYWAPDLVAGDASVYEAQALGVEQVRAGKEGFVILLGWLYWALGRAPAAGLLVNALLMGLLVTIVAKTAARVWDEQAAMAAAVMAVLLPPFVWWGSQLLREAPMWILIALAADVAMTIALDGLSFKRASWLLILCLGMLTIRAPVAAVVAVSLSLGLMLSSAPRTSDHFRRMAMIGAAIALAVFLFPRFEALQSLEEQDSASIVDSRNYLATANTGFGEQAAPTTTGLYSQLPTALPLVTFGPLPWQLPSSGLVAVTDTLAWWFVLFLGARGFGPLHRLLGRASWMLLFPAAALLGVLALTLANFGIVIRMRAMVVVLLLPYAAVGLAASARRRGHAGHFVPVRGGPDA